MALLALLGSGPFLMEAIIAITRLSSGGTAEPILIAKSLLILVPLIPLTIAIWAWHAGTDANEYGIRVRALLGRQIIPWAEVDTLAPDGHGHSVAVLKSGQIFRLTAVKPTDLPRLIAARGTPATLEPAANRG